MKTTTLLLTAIVILSLPACNNEKHDENTSANPAGADTLTTAPAETPEEIPMDSAAAAKAWMDYGTPSEAHKMMARQEGKWEAELTFWPAAGAPADGPHKTSQENEMILGGRYLQSRYKGKMMGMDFEGIGTTAFDNARKKYLSTWIDNMGTGLMYMEGEYDEASKSLELKGKMVDAMSGKEIDCRSSEKWIDDKTIVMEMYCTQKGQEFKSMEIRMSKK